VLGEGLAGRAPVHGVVALRHVLEEPADGPRLGPVEQPEAPSRPFLERSRAQIVWSGTIEPVLLKWCSVQTLYAGG
jgi:hypothetical protein